MTQYLDISHNNNLRQAASFLNRRTTQRSPSINSYHITMSSIRNLLFSFSAFASILHLGSCKQISGTGNITVTDLNTGDSLGCLVLSSFQLVQVRDDLPCSPFSTSDPPKGVGSGSDVILSAGGVACGFFLIEGPGSEDQFACGSDLDGFPTNTWSVSFVPEKRD